jgi:hypothetical protein
MDSMQRSPRQGFGGWRDRRREAKSAKRQRKAAKEAAARKAAAERSPISSRTYQEIK